MSKQNRPFHPKNARERLGFILILLFCFVLGVGALGKGWYEFLLLQKEGVTKEGVVVDRNTTVKGDQQITYQYEVAGPDGVMRSFEFTRLVTRDFSAIPGEAIPVVYLPDRPELSNLAGNRFVLIGDIVWATIIFGVIEGFVGFLLVLHILEWKSESSKK